MFKIKLRTVGAACSRRCLIGIIVTCSGLLLSVNFAVAAVAGRVHAQNIEASRSLHSSLPEVAAGGSSDGMPVNGGQDAALALKQAGFDVQRQISAVQDQLARQQSLYGNLEADLNKLKDEGKAKEAEYIFIKGILAKVGSEYKAAQANFLDSAAKLNEQEKLYADRLVALFETRSSVPSVFELLLSADSIEDFLRHYEFTRLIADSDRQLLDKYRILQDKAAKDLELARTKESEYQSLLELTRQQLDNLEHDISLKEANLLLSKKQIGAKRLQQLSLLRNKAAYEAELRRIGEAGMQEAAVNEARAEQGVSGKYGSPQPGAEEAAQPGLDAHFAGERLETDAMSGNGQAAVATTDLEASTNTTNVEGPLEETAAINNGAALNGGDSGAAGQVNDSQGLVAGQNDGFIAVQSPALKAELAALPWVFPNIYSRVVTCNFGYFDAVLYDSYPHRGIDFAADFGSKIVAALPGTVAVVNNPFEGENYATGGSTYGNYIVVDHGNGLRTLYAHLKNTLVTVGQNVVGGELIALAGSTGNSEGPHLHFEIQYYGELQDPYLYVGNR